jgi:hypothetical protein
MIDDFLGLCGFGEKDISEKRNRVIRAFEIAGIGAEDVERGKQRIKVFFDIQLQGVRRILGIWLKEFIDLVMAKEDKKTVVYLSYPTLPEVASTLARIPGVYASAPEVIVDVVMGQIFDKLSPTLEMAERRGLPGGYANCSVLQARVGAIECGLIPVPDLTLTSSFLCDEAPKVDEVLLHVRHGVPVVHIDGCVDDDWRLWPAVSPRRLEYFERSLRDSLDVFEQVTGQSVKEEMIVRGTEEYMGILRSCVELNDLLETDPIPMSAIDMGVIFWLIRGAFKAILEEGLEVMSLLTEEVRKRCEKGIGKIEKNAPRILFSWAPTTDPRILRIVEESGLAVPVTSHGAVKLTSLGYGDKEFSSVYQKIATSALSRAVRHSIISVAQEMLRLVKDWGLDGAIAAYHFSDRCACVFGPITKEVLTAQNIPTLLLEYDQYDTRSYTPESMRTKIETFAQMLKMKKEQAKSE